ncbi:MAG: phosphonoacetaldehyde reductase [Verrucomicrobia bacterium]|nr:phosphonoacetaldehyde reductase [Verrucomicrobiota bacterium]
MKQKIITPGENYKGLDDWIKETGAKKILMVCDGSIWYQKEFNAHLEEIEKTGVEMIGFRDFQPNPLYENVQAGVKLFRDEQCDAIIAVGGGSAMDVAKCIKLYSNLPGDGENGSWLNAEYVENNVPFLAMPTTAGTGSEATRYAVIYYDGKKQSVTSESFIPGTVLMDPNTLITLPPYQKKATMCDALCHAIESYWSVNSTEESKGYSKTSIQGVMEHMDGYLNNTEEGRAGMLRAAHTAGKAINITQTTAGHAMCYKITSLLRSAHGHAAILCDRVLFPWMVKNTDKCIDPRGEEYLKRTLDEIGVAMGCEDAQAGATKLVEIFDKLELDVPTATAEQYDELKTGVNPVRLKNHPVQLTVDTIDSLYHDILR